MTNTVAQVPAQAPANQSRVMDVNNNEINVELTRVKADTNSALDALIAEKMQKKAAADANPDNTDGNQRPASTPAEIAERYRENLKAQNNQPEEKTDDKPKDKPKDVKKDVALDDNTDEDDQSEIDKTLEKDKKNSFLDTILDDADENNDNAKKQDKSKKESVDTDNLTDDVIEETLKAGRTGESFKNLKNQLKSLKDERAQLKTELETLKSGPVSTKASEELNAKYEELNNKFIEAQRALFMVDVRNTEEFVQNVSSVRDRIVKKDIIKFAEEYGLSSTACAEIYKVVRGGAKAREVAALQDLPEEGYADLRDLTKDWRRTNEIEDVMSVKSAEAFKLHKEQQEKAAVKTREDAEKAYKGTLKSVHETLGESPKLSFLFHKREENERNKEFNERLERVFSSATSVKPHELNVAQMGQLVYKSAAADYLSEVVVQMRDELKKARNTINTLQKGSPSAKHTSQPNLAVPAKATPDIKGGDYRNPLDSWVAGRGR